MKHHKVQKIDSSSLSEGYALHLAFSMRLREMTELCVEAILGDILRF